MTDFKYYNHSLIQLAISTLALLFAFVACAPENEAIESKCPEGAVDLGIVMTRADGTTYKLYWAKSNLSTSGLCANETDYGDYYAWGETEPKEDYSWSTYKYGTNRSGPFSKYNTQDSYRTVDNKTVLDSKDDAARVKLDGKWRLPTTEEWNELLRKCSFEWVDINGVVGLLVTGKNGNTIFLPPAGYRNGTKVYYPAHNGYYGSSSLVTNFPYTAWGVSFPYLYGILSGTGERLYGFSIRPVSE